MFGSIADARCLIDTGAGVSVFPSSLLPGKFRKTSLSSIRLQTADGKPLEVSGEVDLFVSFIDSSKRVEFNHKFYVANIVTGPIIGADFLKYYGMKVDFAASVLHFGDDSCPIVTLSASVCDVVLAHDVVFKDGHSEVLVKANLIRDGQPVSSLANSLFMPKVEVSRDTGVIPASALVDGSSTFIPVKLLCVLPRPRAKLKAGTILGHIEHSVDISRLAVVADFESTGSEKGSKPVLSKIDVSNSSLSVDEQRQLIELVEEYQDVFSSGEGDLGRTNVVRHKIPTGDNTHTCQRNYRQPYHQRQEIQRQVDILLEKGVVEESVSPWSSPVLMVPKKDGSSRFCVDFRKLNSITKDQEYPIPRIDESLESLAGSKMFTTLDLASGYWQVEVEEEDREKTAFSTSQGHYQFLTMPMGLKGAPATFQHLMNLVLRGLHWSSVLVYLDDIIIFAPSFQEHQQRLREVFDRLREAGLKLKPSKCHFAQESVAFLGHIVSVNGIQTDPAKTERISSWPTPRSVEEIRSFLGLATYYRRFVENFSAIAAPLTNLTGKSVSYQWTDVEDTAFSLLKEKLCSDPVLAHPIFDESHEFVIKTDASGVGIGAVLTQVQSGKERVIAYGSRKLNKAEQSYSVPEREALAVVWGVNHFRQFLYGRHFTIITDHQPLTYLRTMKDPKGKFARWLNELSTYEFDVRYKPGKNHGDADALSRRSYVTIGATTILDDQKAVCLAQQSDSVIKRVMEQLCTDERPNYHGDWTTGPLAAFRRVWHQLEIRNGVLVRHGAQGQIKLVVPKSLFNDVLHSIHDVSTSGHFGIGKTFDRLRQRFYWPGYAAAVEKYVKSCEICQRRNNDFRRANAPLQPIKADAPFEIIAMDFLELPRTPRGNKYCLVVSDYYTKWPEVFALPDQQALTVAKVLIDGVISRHGIPNTLLSDQGGSFENDVIRELCRMLGIHKVRTSPYHPEADGLVERLNRTFLNILAKYVGDKPEDWDLWLSTAAFAYRSAKQASTGFSPFQLLYGRDPVEPVDWQFRLPKNRRTRDALAYFSDVQRYHRLARERIEENVSFAQNRQATDKTTVYHHKYAVGDRVWLHNPAIRHGPGYKLRSSWTGPYVVRKVIGLVNFKIQRVSGGQCVVVHYNRLKPHIGRSASSSSSSSLSAEPSPSSDHPAPASDSVTQPNTSGDHSLTSCDSISDLQPSTTICSPTDEAEDRPTSGMDVDFSDVVEIGNNSADDGVLADVNDDSSESDGDVAMGLSETTQRRSTRVRRAPVRFRDFVI